MECRIERENKINYYRKRGHKNDRHQVSERKSGCGKGKHQEEISGQQIASGR